VRISVVQEAELCMRVRNKRIGTIAMNYFLHFLPSCGLARQLDSAGSKRAEAVKGRTTGKTAKRPPIVKSSIITVRVGKNEARNDPPLPGGLK
jgi:hypothetical protein